MRTDPRVACANAEERFLWAWLHDAVCHPLMALTNWSRWSLAFHDWTSFKAWPRATAGAGRTVVVQSRLHGALAVREVAPRIYAVKHPAIRHTFTTKADDAVASAELAEAWFLTLADVGIHPHGMGLATEKGPL